MDVNYSFDSRLQKECRRIFANIYMLKYWTSSEQKTDSRAFVVDPQNIHSHLFPATSAHKQRIFFDVPTYCSKCSLSFAMILSMYVFCQKNLFTKNMLPLITEKVNSPFRKCRVRFFDKKPFASGRFYFLYRIIKIGSNFEWKKCRKLKDSVGNFLRKIIIRIYSADIHIYISTSIEKSSIRNKSDQKIIVLARKIETRRSTDENKSRRRKVHKREGRRSFYTREY